MIRVFPYLLILMLVWVTSNAQVTENFNDGDFLNNPVWTGNSDDFIVNSSLQLQSNSTVSNSSYFITTPNTLAITAQWEIYSQVTFNPSSANYIDIWLISSSADLTLITNTGYFVRIGNTDDEVSLYRKDGNGITTKIIDGANGILNSSSNEIKTKVTRDAGNQWILSADLTGTGNSYVRQGSVTDASYTSSSFFGVYIKQSTASFFQRHFFDDIEIKNYVPDITAPVVQSATAISSTAIDVLFNESVEEVSGAVAGNYSVNNNFGIPITAVPDPGNPSLVHLVYATSLSNAVAYTLTVSGVKDLAGNVVINGTAGFSFYTPQQYDIVIDEIMTDPTPQTGLPANEWIELKNTAAFDINLQGWTLSDLNGQTGAMPAFVLHPDSFVIICAGSSAAALASFGRIVTVTNFPSLDNDNDIISVFSASGRTIHSVNYSSAWYQNELKKEGGWSLEMTDTRNPCSGISNWKASIDKSGGTPGTKNSVDGINIDETAPRLLGAFPVNNTAITLQYDEPLDSLEAATTHNYSIDNGISAINASSIAPSFNQVNILLNTAITAGTVYTIRAAGVIDCKGNSIGPKNMARFGLQEEADSSDIVINEILFNPKPGGEDYVELYNRSQKIIDLSHTFIANRNSSNVVSGIEQITAGSVLLFPNDFILLTSSPVSVKNQYITGDPDAFIEVGKMPSFPDDLGNVIILNNQGAIVDEVRYSDKWHFPLISNTEGVSLERIQYDGASVQANFHSAATSAGYGTPAYRNSQYRVNEAIQGTITVTPDVFSPDNDGTDDFATIDYNFPSPGYVANITIFDASGRPVRYLQRNALNGIKGYYRWDGLNDKNAKLPQGIYIIYTEIFNTEGKKKQFKNTIVLARRF